MDALLRTQPVEIEEAAAHARRLARAGELTDLDLIEVCILAGVADDENAAEEEEALASGARFDPWRNWLVEAWHAAVNAWGKANPGTVIDCTPTWDGRSSWASQAEWHKRARESESDQERTERRCQSLARNWRTWEVRELSDVRMDILDRGITTDPKQARELAQRAIEWVKRLG